MDARLGSAEFDGGGGSPGYGFQTLDLDGASRSKPFLHGARDIPFHWHREMEILFVLQGTARLVVDGRVCLMHADDLMIINADVPHNSMSLSDDTLIAGVHLDAEHVQRLGLPGFAERAYRCKSFLHGKPFRKVVLPMKAFIARMILHDTRRPEDALVRATMATALSCYIYRMLPFDPIAHSGGPVRAESRERILRIMHGLARPGRAPALGEIARAEHVSLSHLSRLFRAHTGLSFRDYAQNVRIDGVVEDLLTTSAPLGRIMDERGVGNPSVFFHRFRRRFGCSPAELRRLGTAGRPADLPEAMRAVARRRLESYLPELAAAAEAAFGLAAGQHHVELTALHQPPTAKPARG
ncbi:helix-turn-helix domain-containing protein [Labrys wisconsinensis]|uniref:AraC-like DNA-binding protein n=1 Tax=Labrys wisconsinensis TaxID=425677 RepID=A0ABU0J7Q5_9HYPH|nr:helix-turn-helix domain-containing protein [Labrys wisconsinensis]MDQ0470305.1 AraC-like DNA-binding protein [Labrys wisconsinensis]